MYFLLSQPVHKNRKSIVSFVSVSSKMADGWPSRTEVACIQILRKTSRILPILDHMLRGCCPPTKSMCQCATHLFLKAADQLTHSHIHWMAVMLVLTLVYLTLMFAESYQQFTAVNSQTHTQNSHRNINSKIRNILCCGCCGCRIGVS